MSPVTSSGAALVVMDPAHVTGTLERFAGQPLQVIGCISSGVARVFDDGTAIPRYDKDELVRAL